MKIDFEGEFTAEKLGSEDNALLDVQSGEYERHYKVKAGDVVLDLGACVGHFSELVLPRLVEGLACGTCIAFEPDPVNYARLLRRCSGHSCFYPVNAAASNADALGMFWHYPGHCGGNSLVRPVEQAKPVPVLQLNIGKWLDQFRVKPVFAKIDTEGAEFDILDSMFAFGHFPSIAVECHTTELHALCRGLCRRFGYEWVTGSQVGMNWAVRA